MRDGVTRKKKRMEIKEETIKGTLSINFRLKAIYILD